MTTWTRCCVCARHLIRWGLCNPGKIIPMLRGCGEARVMSVPECSDGAAGVLASNRRGVASPNLAGQSAGKAQPSRNGWTQSRDALPRHFDLRCCRNHLSTSLGSKCSDSASSTFDPAISQYPLSPQSPFSPLRVSPSPRLPISPVTPGSIAEVCEVMKLASQRSWSVVPAGAGDLARCRKSTSRRIDIVISTPA